MCLMLGGWKKFQFVDQTDWKKKSNGLNICRFLLGKYAKKSVTPIKLGSLQLKQAYCFLRHFCRYYLYCNYSDQTSTEIFRQTLFYWATADCSNLSESNTFSFLATLSYSFPPSHSPPGSQNNLSVEWTALKILIFCFSPLCIVKSLVTCVTLRRETMLLSRIWKNNWGGRGFQCASRE